MTGQQGITRLASHLYQIRVPLPDNPLRHTNTYLLLGERSLLIDTGMDLDVCEKALRASLHQLGVSLQRMDYFITHMHPDHAGLVGRLVQPGCRVYCSPAALDFSRRLEGFGRTAGDTLRQWGAPEALCRQDWAAGFSFGMDWSAHAVPLQDGQELYYGGRHLRYLATPGHMLDHGALFEAERENLFCGDTVLANITPSIASYSADGEELADYLHSLDKLAALPVRTAWCGHGPAVTDFSGRIRQLKEHHGHRLAEVAALLGATGLSVMQVARGIRWNLMIRNWDDFCDTDKLFSMAEAHAHLICLCGQGLASKTRTDGVWRFQKTAGQVATA